MSSLRNLLVAALLGAMVMAIAIAACVDRPAELDAATSDAGEGGVELIGAAPSRPQGPVANPNADIAGNYNTGPWGDAGLWVRGLGGVLLAWDGGSATPAIGQAVMVVDGGGGTYALQFQVPIGDAGGITQFTGDTVAGPGTGSQVASTRCIWGECFADGGTNAPVTANTWLWNGTLWVPGFVNVGNGVVGTLLAGNGGTGFADSGNTANLCLMSSGAGGWIINTCTGGFTPALDLGPNPDGGAGQVVVGVHGPGGGFVPWYNPGIAVDPAQTNFTIQYGGEAGVSAVPGDVNFTPQRPNKAATIAANQSPGEINENLYHPIGSGTWPTWNVVAADDCTGGVGCSYQWAMGQIGPGLPLSDGGVQTAPSAYLWGSVLPGATLTSNNYTMYTSGGTNGTTNLNSPGYITLNVGNNIYEGIDIFKPGIGQVSAITAAGGSTIGMSAFVFNYPSVNPVYGILPTISDTATTSVSLIGQSSNAGATGSHQNAGPVAICGGEHAGSTGATDGVTTLGAGYTLTSYPQCNVTATVDGFGITLAGVTTSGCGAIGGELMSNGSGAPGYCDQSGAFKTFDSIGGGGCNSIGATTGDILSGTPASCGASVNTHVSTITGGGGGTTEVEVNLQMDNVNTEAAGAGHGWLSSNIRGAAGGHGQWVGSGGAVTEFAPSGSGTVSGHAATTLTDTFYATTTSNGTTVAINAPVATHQSGFITFYIEARVSSAGASAAVDDSFIYVYDLPVNNPSGTPQLLTTTAASRQSLAYSTSQSGITATVGTNPLSGLMGIQATQAGSPNVGATIQWTLTYIAVLN